MKTGDTVSLLLEIVAILILLLLRPWLIIMFAASAI